MNRSQCGNYRARRSPIAVRLAPQGVRASPGRLRPASRQRVRHRNRTERTNACSGVTQAELELAAIGQRPRTRNPRMIGDGRHSDIELAGAFDLSFTARSRRPRRRGARKPEPCPARGGMPTRRAGARACCSPRPHVNQNLRSDDDQARCEWTCRDAHRLEAASTQYDRAHDCQCPKMEGRRQRKFAARAQLHSESAFRVPPRRMPIIALKGPPPGDREPARRRQG